MFEPALEHVMKGRSLPEAATVWHLDACWVSSLLLLIDEDSATMNTYLTPVG